jgi:hypothetical protein
MVSPVLRMLRVVSWTLVSCRSRVSICFSVGSPRAAKVSTQVSTERRETKRIERKHGFYRIWPDGGIGRRTGLKILWEVTPVRVRVPLRLLLQAFASACRPSRKSLMGMTLRDGSAESLSGCSPSVSSHRLAWPRSLSRPPRCARRCAICPSAGVAVSVPVARRESADSGSPAPNMCCNLVTASACCSGNRCPYVSRVSVQRVRRLPL